MDRRKRAADAYRRARDGAPLSPNEDTTPHRTGESPPSGSPSQSDPPSGSSATPSEPRTERTSSNGFDKTTGPTRDHFRGPAPTAPVDPETLERLLEGSGPDRAARLLVALGTERAAQILRRLDEEEVEAIAASIVTLQGVPKRELDAILAELPKGRQDAPLKAGPDVARRMLTAAFGEEEGGRIFFRAIPNAPAHHFAFLNELEPGQLHSVVKDEPDAAAALILAHVDRRLAARALALLPTARRAEVARRIARMGKLSHDVVTRVEEAVREKIRRQGRQVTQGVDGPATLAAILRHLAPSKGDEILGALRDADVDLSETIRERLYTSDMVASLSDRHLADLLREFSDREIALFLKGKDQTLRERVLRSLSQRRGEMVSDEYAHLGVQRREDVDRVTREVLARMRELEEEGSILVPREGDRYI
ncbi:MAG: flagellar motor switch protein FliG [Spirochaetota bacterium]